LRTVHDEHKLIIIDLILVANNLVRIKGSTPIDKMDVELKELEKQLLSACKEGNIEVVIQLLNDGNVNPNCQDKENSDRTPLDYACQEGHIDIVKLLLNQRIDINKAVNKIGNSKV